MMIPDSWANFIPTASCLDTVTCSAMGTICTTGPAMAPSLPRGRCCHRYGLLLDDHDGIGRLLPAGVAVVGRDLSDHPDSVGVGVQGRVLDEDYPLGIGRRVA